MCDDGNRVGADGCNAWCSQFDLMTKTCTVAGGATAASATQLSTPAQSQFVSLTAVAVSPLTDYAVLADGGTLIKMPLYSAQTTLSAVASTTYSRFCTLRVMADAVSILAYECLAQEVIMYAGGGTHRVASLNGLLAPALAVTGAYFDPQAGELLVPGVPLAQSGASADASTCAMLYAVNIATGATRIAGDVPCVIYNVSQPPLSMCSP